MADESQPKHLLSLLGDTPLIVETARRFTGAGFSRPVLAVNKRDAEKTHRVLSRHSILPQQVLCEPIAKDTCVSIALACAWFIHNNQDPVLLFSPSDHFIADDAPLHQAILEGFEACQNESIVTFGTMAKEANTRLGYIELVSNNARSETTKIRAVSGFQEKPTEYEAKQLVHSGHHFCNLGLLLAKASVMFGEIERYRPDVSNAALAAVARAKSSEEFIEFDPSVISSLEAQSIDYEILSKSDKLVAVETELEWADLGTWHSVIEAARKFGRFEYLAKQMSERSDRQASFRAIARKNPLPETVTKPWGAYTIVDRGPSHLTKRLVIKPNGSTSLQYHDYRSEHWVVVSGAGELSLNGKSRKLVHGESAFIPARAIHRISNDGTEPLVLIETQYGEMCSESDIIRLADQYGRVMQE